MIRLLISISCYAAACIAASLGLALALYAPNLTMTVVETWRQKDGVFGDWQILTGVVVGGLGYHLLIVFLPLLLIIAGHSIVWAPVAIWAARHSLGVKLAAVVLAPLAMLGLGVVGELDAVRPFRSWFAIELLFDEAKLAAVLMAVVTFVFFAFDGVAGAILRLIPRLRGRGT
jgi:hypothetical protein